MILFSRALIFCFLASLSLSSFGHSSESFNPLHDSTNNPKRAKISDSSLHNKTLTNGIDEEQTIIPPRKSAFSPFVPRIEEGILHIIDVANSAKYYYELILAINLVNPFINELYISLAEVIIQYRKACEKNEFPKILKLYFQVRIVNREFYKACSNFLSSNHSYSNQGLGKNKRKC